MEDLSKQKEKQKDQREKRVKKIKEKKRERNEIDGNKETTLCLGAKRKRQCKQQRTETNENQQTTNCPEVEERQLKRQEAQPRANNNRISCVASKSGTGNRKLEYLTLGDPEYECRKCNAKMWFNERVVSTSTKGNTNFNMCCRDGKVRLTRLKEPPPLLKNLLTGEGQKSTKFRQLIRKYNSCYAFTSMGAKIDNSVNDGPGPYVYRISGQVIHRIGSLLPATGLQPIYAQLYVYDSTSEITMRQKALGIDEGSDKLDNEILKGLLQMLDEENPLAQTFRMARERIRNNEDDRITIRLLGTLRPADRVYNTPTASEIAALIVNDTGGGTQGRDIIIEHRRDGLQRITELHPRYMALQYPLLFPYGEDGFHTGIKYCEEGKKGIRGRVTIREYYAYQIQQRNTEGCSLICGGRLFQQYLVDCCTAIETGRLRYLKNHQDIFRCDLLHNLCDAVAKGDGIGSAVGKRIYLPPSFTGGPRYMQQNYHDAMAICRKYGNPHLFITFTANPKWPEIEAMIKEYKCQKAEDRLDIVARVFKLKLKQLMNCLKEEKYFGPTAADVYTIEFQKRGLPHAHILLWLEKSDVHQTTQFIDSIICAEIPDKQHDPQLYEIVSRSMVHGPCGPSNPKCGCMKNNTCSKKYPKSFNSQTTFDQNRYPVYSRTEDGRYITKGDHQMDNRSIVPYNPGLLLLFDAHINVEWCNTARAIKYLFKYISKGPDKATMILKDETIDEIKAYQDCRYLSSCEAAWRIFEFEIQERHPAVTRLPVHLEGEQSVTIKDFDVLKDVNDKVSDQETMLTSWMSTNKTDKDARKHTYAEFPQDYVWNKKWEKRQQRTSIGRMTYVHPTAGERYYLRLLLNIVRGAQSYADIRTVKGVLYTTFKEACDAHGLLTNDKEWHDALREASQWGMPSQLRELFVTMILFCEVTDVANLWETHYEALSDDMERRKQKLFDDPNLVLSEEHKKTYTLIEIDRILAKYGKRLKDISNMPQPKVTDVEGMENKLIREERAYDREKLQQEWMDKETQLNDGQKVVYNAVINAVDKGEEAVMFLYGHGGTGKTFLYGALSSRIRSTGRIVINVASSGIAALLLPGGRTAHSRFEIPIELSEETTCNVRQNSHLAELLRQASLIIWDEAPMDHRHAFEALDRTMRDILTNKDPDASTKMFGGIPVLMGGDFRQVLPIVGKAGRQDTVQASINRSPIWNTCKVYTLTTSMRVRDTGNTVENKKFNEWLLALGEGRLEAKIEDGENEATWVKIPREYLYGTGKIDIKNLQGEIYPGFKEKNQDIEYLRERAILTPLNETADTVNEHMADLLPGEYQTYKSCDEICASSIEGDEQFTNYPTEYLNSLHLQGLPKHELKLKKGMPVMLLRNINPSQGLCNGTRLIITRMGKFVVEARIITGPKVGETRWIPRIVMTSNDTKIPFIMKRRQYPLKACYAMTINKSQGQSLTHVGIYLPKPVFSHGQLYVAASRTTSPRGVKFFIDDREQQHKGHTRNIVYKEVFTNLPTVT